MNNGSQYTAFLASRKNKICSKRRHPALAEKEVIHSSAQTRGTAGHKLFPAACNPLIVLSHACTYRATWPMPLPRTPTPTADLRPAPVRKPYPAGESTIPTDLAAPMQTLNLNGQ